MACASGPPGYEETSQSWREEVQLQDGRMIEVTRTEYYSAYCGPGIRCRTTRGGATRSRIEFELDGKVVSWEEQMAPMILQLEHEMPIVVATFASCGQYRSYGKSDRTVPAYIAFRYEEGTWRKLEVDKLEMDLDLDSNLLVNDAKFGSKTSLKDKQEWNAARGLSTGFLRVHSNRNIARQCFGG
jgi:hypothetical protein